MGKQTVQATKGLSARDNWQMAENCHDDQRKRVFVLNYRFPT